MIAIRITRIIDIVQLEHRSKWASNRIVEREQGIAIME